MALLVQCPNCLCPASPGHIADCIGVGQCRWCFKEWEDGLHQCTLTIELHKRHKMDRETLVVAERFKAAMLSGAVLHDEPLIEGTLPGWWRVHEMTYTRHLSEGESWKFTVKRDPPPVPLRPVKQEDCQCMVLVPPATEHPCAVVYVTHERAVYLMAEGRSGPACRVCGWWLEEVTQHGSRDREFVHTRPVLPLGVHSGL